MTKWCQFPKRNPVVQSNFIQYLFKTGPLFFCQKTFDCLIILCRGKGIGFDSISIGTDTGFFIFDSYCQSLRQIYTWFSRMASLRPVRTAKLIHGFGRRPRELPKICEMSTVVFFFRRKSVHGFFSAGKF